LDCGCCGLGFFTWEGYEDQDQDEGYGICRSCQGHIEEKNMAQYEDMYRQILEAVAPETRAKMEAKVAEDPSNKIGFVNHALDRGYFTFKVVPA